LSNERTGGAGERATTGAPPAPAALSIPSGSPKHLRAGAPSDRRKGLWIKKAVDDAASVGVGNRGGMFTGGRAERLLDYAFVENDAFVLRGLIVSSNLGGGRLENAGLEAPALIDFIMSRDCPVRSTIQGAERTHARSTSVSSVQTQV
jgi:hypothetical protein